MPLYLPGQAQTSLKVLCEKTSSIQQQQKLLMLVFKTILIYFDNKYVKCDGIFSW